MGDDPIRLREDEYDRVAPDDKDVDKAWDQIMQVARKHCLVIQAYGGVATLAVPVEQRKSGIREKVLRTHRATEVV
ncbi:hypothetical protein LCGC14_2096750 [marine sediment metagenome]|uniref:Uncharacterized protein n=1 Tax=marine sediment metagenome TaxID=412755 RepID=A0A0F9EBE3_9ZZZZ